MTVNWVGFRQANDVAAAAADTLKEHARHAIATRGSYRLLLAGGSTPLQAYRILAEQDLDWQHWSLFYGDERCLPEQHPDRNSQLVKQTGLVDKIDQHFPVPCELSPEAAARCYAEIIHANLPFDTVLLGMGEDGHTASLFPGQFKAIDESEASVIAVHDSPKPPADRVSLSGQSLLQCRQMLVLITGASKQWAVQQWQQGDSLPISVVAEAANATVYCEHKLLEH